MAITIEELKSLIREETIREALQHVKENTEYFKRFANQLLLFLSYQTFEKAEETFLKIMSLENVWEMGNSRYTHYLQWLPREVLEDTVELLPAKDLLSLLEQLASLLLELGAEVEAKDQVGFAPLHRAITRKNLFMVHFLLNNGAIVDVKNNLGSTPLYDAVWIKNESLVRLLLEKGADVNAKDRQGLTPLHCWALWEEGDNPTAQLLLDKGAGDNPIGQLLLDKGANVNAKDKEGNTPL
ncbi:MAG: uncharacterized protein K0R48_1499, partial [Gammaproteobacteria bacterium]|nr:uncharacterized protein [Gammaproteobacteria bacterium]